MISLPYSAFWPLFYFCQLLVIQLLLHPVHLLLSILYSSIAIMKQSKKEKKKRNMFCTFLQPNSL